MFTYAEMLRLLMDKDQRWNVSEGFKCFTDPFTSVCKYNIRTYMKLCLEPIRQTIILVGLSSPNC